MPRERLVLESEPPVAEPLPGPRLVVPAQVQDQHAPARPHHPGGLRDRRVRVLGVVERLRQHGDVQRRVRERQPFDVSALPLDVGDAAAFGHRPGFTQRLGRSVDGHDPSCPPGRLEREVALAAAEVAEVHRWKQVSQSPCPGGPTASGFQRSARALGTGSASFRRRSTSCNRASSACVVSSSASPNRWSSSAQTSAWRSRPAALEVRERRLSRFVHQPGVPQQPEVPGHAGLRQTRECR